MADVVLLDDWREPWKEVFVIDGSNSSLQVFVNKLTGEAELVQVNDDLESVRTCMSTRDLYELVEVLQKHRIIPQE